MAEELAEALRSTGAVREFLPDPVGDEVVARVLELARFAPNGGNRQAWRVVLVKDPERRRAIRHAYLAGWYEYLALGAAGLTPWAPVGDRAAEENALTRVPAMAEAGRRRPGFPEALDRVPVLLALFADLRRLAAVDRDRPGYHLVGGASIYPFAWSLLLAARGEGLAGVLTTMAVRRAEEVNAALEAPPELALAGILALGRPARTVRRLRRAPVASFATVDRLDGPPLG